MNDCEVITMPYCPNCGTSLADNANFCWKCGTRTSAPAAPSAPVQTPYQAPQPPVQPVAPVGNVFSQITVRYRCPNGHVFDGSDAQTACPTCGAPLPKGGFIHVYRMGNYMGMAVGMGVYVDDMPYGHIGNKQSIRISVPYGPHKLHMTHTTTRACNDPVFNITPQYPHICCKAHFSKAGFKIMIEPASPDSMPLR